MDATTGTKKHNLNTSDVNINHNKDKKQKLSIHNSRIFLGNLPFGITDDEIYKIFENIPIKINNIHYVLDKTKQTFYGTAFIDIEYELQDTMESVLSKNKFKLKGREIKIEESKKSYNNLNNNNHKKLSTKNWKPQEYTGNNTIFIGNVNADTSDDEVVEFFSDICKDDVNQITRIRWVYDKKEKFFTGCGFVVFSGDPAITIEAVKKNGLILHNNKIRIDYT